MTADRQPDDSFVRLCTCEAHTDLRDGHPWMVERGARHSERCPLSGSAGVAPEVKIGAAEAVAALRAKRDATTNPRYREELDAQISHLEAQALDVLVARATRAGGQA